MKPTNYSIIAIVMILLIAAPTFAYDEDTHFLVTYVMCRSVGFSDKEALLVAAVDQGMDDSDATNAHDGPKPRVTEEWMWHALDKDGKMHASGVLARRDALFAEALNEKDPRNRLVRLGIFFHFQQDTWAHRHHEKDSHLARDAYVTFNTPAGHAAFGPQPDRPPYDPVAALMCLEDGIAYAADFLHRGLGRTPNAFFKNYVPTGGKVDEAWKDKKQGKFFNQIDLSTLVRGSAQLFVASLIRAQIDAYPQSPSPNIIFLGKQTADKLDFEPARAALQNVCARFRFSIGNIFIPSQTDKIAQGFTNMTTQNLLSLRAETRP